MVQYISSEFMIVKIIILITMKYKMMKTNTILQKMILVTKLLLIMNPKFSSPIMTHFIAVHTPQPRTILLYPATDDPKK